MPHYQDGQFDFGSGSDFGWENRFLFFGLRETSAETALCQHCCRTLGAKRQTASRYRRHFATPCGPVSTNVGARLER